MWELTNLFLGYVQGLRDADIEAVDRDSDTLIALDLATVRLNSLELDDANTMFAQYIDAL